MLLRGSLFGVTFLIVFSSSANAANVFNYGTALEFATADLACVAGMDASNAGNSNHYFDYFDSVVEYTTATNGKCLASKKDNFGNTTTGWWHHSWNQVIGDCPEGYIEGQDGFCSDAPDCPPDIVAKVTVPIFVEGTSNGTVNITGTPPSFDVSGCEYLATSLVACGLNACTYMALSSGMASVAGESLTTGVTVDDYPPTNNNITNNETTDYAPYGVVNNPDGSTTTTEGETTTTTTGSGTTVVNGTNVTTVTNSDGSVTTTTVTTTTTSYPDGSSETTTTTTTETTDSGGTQTDIPSDPSSPVTQTDIPGGDSEGTSTTTTGTDPDGNVTDSSDNCTGTECPPVEEEPVEEEPFNPEFPIGTGSFDDALIDINSDVAIAKQDLLTTFNTIKGEINALFSFTAGSGGSLPCPPPVVIANFGEFDICMTEYESQLAFVAQALFFVASFLAIAIILR